VGLNVLLDKFLQRLIAHPKVRGFFVLGKEGFAVEVEAVVAIQITDWADRFGEDVEGKFGRHAGPFVSY
jgi:hypothetical protein